MQPFDALTMRAVLAEAKPLLINCRVEAIDQLGKDEILITFRGGPQRANFRICAHPLYGRLCLVEKAALKEQSAGSKQGRSTFLGLLKKTLTGARLIALEQLPGERVADLVFSARDELGAAALKMLTVEIMGRHSNIILWDQASQKIIATSHPVTRQMSRFRELLPGGQYIRPPSQAKANIFAVSSVDFTEAWQQQPALAQDALPASEHLSAWLIANYAGLGKTLAFEIVDKAISMLKSSPLLAGQLKEQLWHCIERVQGAYHFKPAMMRDRARYTVLGWLGDCENQWQTFNSVNDLVEEFYASAALQQSFQQLRERMLAQRTNEINRLESRIKERAHFNSEIGHQGKLFGDLILANLANTQLGQKELICDNVFAEAVEPIVIPLQAGFSAVQNAQNYYRQFAKAKGRQKMAALAEERDQSQLKKLKQELAVIENASSLVALESIKHQSAPNDQLKGVERSGKGRLEKHKSGLLKLTSSDGWLIYVGRNQRENDQLLSRFMQPKDIWLHILGQSGSHVIIKALANKEEPPLRTLKEAAYWAAQSAHLRTGAKAQVIYTYGRFVKKVPGGQLGTVRYTHEKTIEVDTAQSTITERVSKENWPDASE